MLFDRNEERRRRALLERQEATARQKEKLEVLRRKERAAKAQLLGSTTRHENWHAHRLVYQDRQAGYVGEMAEARYWVRSLTPDLYREAIAPYADAMHGASIIAVEVAAVRANLNDWARRGQDVLYEQARAAYEEECRSFAAWQAAHPDETDWRDAPATRKQWMLIRRTVDRLEGVAMPVRLKAGEAHDWLERHDANLRFRGKPAPSNLADPGDADASRQASVDKTDGDQTEGDEA